MRHLELSQAEADQLSRVLVNGGTPFLGGSADLRTWDLEIDPRVVAYEDVLDATRGGGRRTASQ